MFSIVEIMLDLVVLELLIVIAFSGAVVGAGFPVTRLVGFPTQAVVVPGQAFLRISC